jgi:hypothetical protein
MKKQIIYFLSAAILLPLVSHGQLGGLKDKMKKAEKSIPPKSIPSPSSTSSPSTESSSAKKDNGLIPVPKTSAAVNFKQHPFPPTILLSSLLEQGFGLHSDQPTPFFFLPKAVFLPNKDVNGNDLNYQGSGLMAGIIRQQDKIIYKEYLEPIGNSVPLVGLQGSESMHVERPSSPMEAGSYMCEIILDGKTIFSMPFEFMVVKNSDPYARDKEFRLMDGYWSKYGYYTFNDDQLMEWNIFLGDLDNTFEKGSKDYKMEAQLFYNGAPLSKVVEYSGSAVRGKWEIANCTFVNINTPKTSTVRINKNDMKDGAYMIKMKTNGVENKYSFNVKDGKHVMIDEQDKTKTTDPSKAFEGMNKEFWVKKS